MQNQFKNSITALILMVLLSACGGEESSVSSNKVASASSPSQEESLAQESTPSEEVSPSKEVSPSQESTPAEEVSPSQESTPTNAEFCFDTTPIIGISGLSMQCGSEDLVIEADGYFTCETAPISAYIGEFKIGDVEGIPTDGLIFIQDFLHLTRSAIAHPEVTKLSMILQSLDSDANPLNGITLDSNVIDLLGSHLNASTVLEDLTFENVDYIIEDVIQTALSQDSNSILQAVDYYTAQSNLAIAVANAPALTYEEREAGGI